MKIGIVGSGKMGGGIGIALSEAGHDVFFSFSRDRSRLESLVQQSGGQWGTPEEAASFGDVLILAVWFSEVEEALRQAGNLTGKIVVTCVSALQPDFTGRTAGLPTTMTLSAAAQIAKLAPGAEVVEAFNLTFAETINAPDRNFGGDRPSLLYCGNSAAAKETVARLIVDCGFDPIDGGSLESAPSMEALASIWVQTAVVTKLFPNVALKFLTK